MILTIMVFGVLIAFGVRFIPGERQSGWGARLSLSGPQAPDPVTRYGCRGAGLDRHIAGVRESIPRDVANRLFGLSGDDVGWW